MDFDEFQEKRPEDESMRDDPMVFAEGGPGASSGTSMDKPDEGFGFGDEKPAGGWDLSDEPGAGGASDDIGSDEPPGEPGGFGFGADTVAPETGAGFGEEPIGYQEAGSTSFFGFFGKGLKIAMLKGGAAEEVAADTNSFVPALVIYTFPSFVAGLLVALFMTALGGAALTEAGPAAQQLQAVLPLIQKFSLSFIVVFPLITLIFSLIYVGILHLFARLFKGSGGFLDYYQTIGVGSLISWGSMVPYVGILFSLWMIPVTVVITSRVHNLSTGRSVAVVLLPILIIFIAVIALFSTMIMALMGASGMEGMQSM